MQDFYLNLLGISFTVSAVGMALVLLSPALNRRFPVSWKRAIWLLLALRLLIPVSMSLPQAPVVVEVPRLLPAAAPAAERGEAMPGTVTGTPSGTFPPSPVQMDATTPYTLAVCIVWLGVAALLLGKSLWGYALFRRRALRWSLPPKPETQKIYQRTCLALGIRRAPPVYQSRQVQSPMLAGALRPVILLPPRGYSPQALELVFCHELTHYKRGDTWLKLTLHTARALHWFNPLVRLMTRQAERDMELACDEGVLGFADSRKLYGSLILEGAAAPCPHPAALTTGLTPGKKQLTERITNIMTRNKRRGGAILLAIALTAVILCGTLVAFSAPADNDPSLTDLTGLLDAYGPLLDLRPQGYGQMTVAAYRDTMLKEIAHNESVLPPLMDSVGENVRTLAQTDPETDYLVNTLIALTADKWQQWNFYQGWQEEDAAFELVLSRIITDAEAATVDQSNEAVAATFREAVEWSRGADVTVLSSENALKPILDEIASRHVTPGLELHLSGWFSRDEAPLLSQGDAVPTPPPTRQDYRDLLALQVEGYENMSVQAYQEYIRGQFAANPGLEESHERVWVNIDGHPIPTWLTESDHQFLFLTLQATVAEYAAERMSQYSNLPRRPFVTVDYDAYTYRDAMDYELVINYDVEWQLKQPGLLTVAQRDRLLESLLREIHEYLLNVPKNYGEAGQSDFVQALTEACAAYSGDAITFGGNVFSFYYMPPYEQF